MKRREFILAGALLPFVYSIKPAYAWSPTAIQYGAAIIAAILAAAASKITEVLLEPDGDCTQTVKYTFDGRQCIQCGSCMPYVEVGYISDGRMACPVEAITAVEITYTCP